MMMIPDFNTQMYMVLYVLLFQDDMVSFLWFLLGGASVVVC